MKRLTLFAAVVFGMSLVGCDNTDINEEIFESELQLIEPSDDGTIDPGEDDEY